MAVVGLGALGSAAAYHLVRKGARVVGFEQFELGHVRGASHDTSRIVRTSYGASQYVRLAQSAYRDWADLERESGEHLLTITGGVVLLPVDGPYSAADFTAALEERGVPHELLSPADVEARWPQFRVPENVETVYTADTGIAHAARTVATLQLRARALGADLRDRTPVERLVPDGSGVVVHTANGDVRADKVVLVADAWTNTLQLVLAAAHGCALDVEFIESYPVTYNDPDETGRVLDVLDARPDPVRRLAEPSMASEDFAYVLQEVPGTLVFLGVAPGSGTTRLHSERATFDDSLLDTHAAVLAELAWRRLDREPVQ